MTSTLATTAPTAHLLLQVDPGRADEVASFVATLPSVREAAVTSGPYDVIAVVDLTDDGLARVVSRARRAPGLTRVCVCRPT
jgi:hypothetical protein